MTSECTETLILGKRKRKVFLWLNRPKKSRLINSPYKQCSSGIDGTPLKTPKETPVKKLSTQKRCLTPVSSHKKTSRKHFKAYYHVHRVKLKTLRPVGIFVHLVESFLITFDVKFIYFRGFCPVMSSSN